MDLVLFPECPPTPHSYHPCILGALHLFSHELEWKRDEVEYVLTVDNLLPVNLPLV